MTINDKELASNLIALAIMCIGNDTDNCDLELTTEMGVINCHIDFEVVKNGTKFSRADLPGSQM